MKRGQVTMFVIIGLAALLIAGLVIMSLRAGLPSSPAAQQDAVLVTSLVEQCLSSVGEDAVRQAALQGGYYDLRALRQTATYESQVIRLEPQVIPLWHEIHACENANGCVGDNRPQLCSGRRCPISIQGGNPQASFQDSIERFAQDRLRSCLDGFRSLPQLQLVEDGEPQVRATIRDNDVLLALEYPLTLTATDSSVVELEEFSATLAVDLPTLYELATEIYALQRQTSFIEEQFLHLLSIYSGIESEIPPMRDAQLVGGTRFWVRRNVQKAVEDQVLPFLNFIQVVNAMGSYTPIRNPNPDPDHQAYGSGVYDYMAVKLAGGEVYPHAVQFQYPYAPMQLDISGKEFLKGRELPGTEFLGAVGGLTFIEYKFRYGAAFPMVVKITDPYAFDGEGLDLYFGIEANIRNNYPVNTSADIVTFRAPDTTLDLSDPKQLVNHLYEVRVLDRRTDQPIPDAGITYVCGGEYQMGATGPDGVWRGKLPYCIAGGFLKAEHLDYAATGIAHNNIEDDGAITRQQLFLWPRIEKEVILYKQPAKQRLGPNETAILTISRHPETPYDSQVPLAGVIEFGTRNSEQEKNNTLELLRQALERGDISQADYDEVIADLRTREEETVELQIIDLVPGTYDLTGFLTYYGLVQIPEERRCGGNAIDRECATLPAQNFTSWNSGGVVLTENDAVSFTEEQVYGNTTLVLYVLEQPLPRTWNEVQAYQHLEDYQTYERRPLVQPEWVSR